MYSLCQLRILELKGNENKEETNLECGGTWL